MKKPIIFKADTGIDMGSSNTLMYSFYRGLLFDESSFIATIQQDSYQKILTMGGGAKIMLGKTPRDISIFRPIKLGKLICPKAAELIIASYLKKAHHLTHRRHLHLIMSSPPYFDIAERKILSEAALATGIYDIYFIEQPLLTALGFNLEITQGTSYMVVDLGGSHSSISIISAGHIFSSISLKISGDFLDQKIIDYIHIKYNVLIDDNLAESIKIQLSSIEPMHIEKKIKIACFDLITNTPRFITITSLEIREIILPYLKMIVSEIKEMLIESPPSVVSDIMSSGIFICGGTSLIPGLCKITSINCGVAVVSASNPFQVTAYGFSHILSNQKKYEHLLF